jgi:two-component system sensor histidine kinase/response regulator
MRRPSRILIVDDNARNLRILEKILEADYSLAMATSGEEALETAPRVAPDLILLDIMMPGIDGYETCRRFRANPALGWTKIIMVSAKAMVSERLEGYAAGADDYLVKPFDESELLAKVRVHLRLKSVEEVDALKTTVLRLLSHETRTPLNGIIAPAQLLASDDDIDASERKELASLIHESATRLQALFDKVLTLAALKSGAREVQLQTEDVDGIARRAIACLVPLASQKGVTIGLRCDRALRAPLDADLMTQAIAALLHNAIRFSPPGGTVTLSLEAAAGRARLAVADCGAGIDPDFLPRVFDEFTTADIAHHTAGHGLSLATVRQSVLAHGGSVTAASEKGAGATFTIEIPLAEEPDDGPTPPARRPTDLAAGGAA